MAVNLVSPGINVREIDLTSGSVLIGTNPIGAFAGPFEKGPINLPILISSEKDLINIFGKPKSSDAQSEYWLSASNYLSYGGVLLVVRSDSSVTGSLNNANSGVSGSPATVKIKSLEDYTNTTPSGYYYASRNPGSWANGLKVCVIDAFADQTIGIGTFGIQVGYGVTIGINTSIAGVGTVTNLNGFLKGVITGVNEGSVDVKIVSRYDDSTNLYENVEYSENTINSISANDVIRISNTGNSKIPIQKGTFIGSATNGLADLTLITPPVSTLNLSLGDVIYSVDGVTSVGSTIINIDSGTNTITLDTNAAGAGLLPFIVGSPGDMGESPISVSDWYNNQTLKIENSTIYWKNVAPKPRTSQYSSERSSRNDQINIIVMDDNGSITGTASNIIEKYILLSKAYDSKVTPSQAVYYENYIADNSSYIFAGVAEDGVPTGFGSPNDFSSGNIGNWGLNSQGVVFSAVGNKSYNLTGGTDYTNGQGKYNSSLSDITSAYSVFKDAVSYPVDFLICGPSGGLDIFESQAKAEELISIAELRKDCVAVISPHKDYVVNAPSSDVQTSNIIKYYSTISSSSYAVFDSGYKYTFDRFNNELLYLACNSDVAGIMARTAINLYPWYSPAGTKRGALNNCIKLAYNPGQQQRDLLYTNRVNPIVSLPGQGTVLFGDKTAQAFASAFDRINVRRLFIAVEKAIKISANDQLFEFNDSVTRSNFVNTIDPYLRDIKAKRGVTDYLIVCDETNNTSEVIDANEFRADIYLKPERSINFITLTFVAARTGTTFQQIVGTV